MLTPRKAEELQDKIYQEMSAERKLEIAGQMFLLGKKLEKLRNQKPYEPNKRKNTYPGRPSLQNSQDFRGT